MSKLSIVISGVVEQSNFDEWKTALTEQIKSVNTDLKTDDDFLAAGKHVKEFKAAEDSPKEAKKTALQKSEEINSLFEAIDTVSEEARQARLKLDKQIKKRKQEIKNDHIDQGVKEIKQFIFEQNDAFKLLATGGYTDKSLFIDALNGKVSAKGMQQAITLTCDSIKATITKKAEDAQANQITLNGLPHHHQALFQDRPQLLDLSPDKLSVTINERISHLEQKAEDASQAKPKLMEEPKVQEAKEPGASSNDSSNSSSGSTSSKPDFKLTIDINASANDAARIQEIVEDALAGNSAVGRITLN